MDKHILLWSIALLLSRDYKRTLGQLPWNPTSSLSRIPGLHPVSGHYSVPAFLVTQTGYSEHKYSESKCPPVERDCPRECKHVDKNSCRVCVCGSRDETMTSHLLTSLSSTSCPPTPRDCPQACRKINQHHCKTCHCEKEEDIHIPSMSGTLLERCHSMITCMLSCKEGYTLGTSREINGCQPCHCVTSHGSEPSGNMNSNEADVSGWGLSNVNSGSSSSFSSWSGSGESFWTTGSDSGSGTMTLGDNGVSMSHYGSDGDGSIWEASNGVGGTSASCSGPMCPGNSGLNPLTPGANTDTGVSSGSSSSCTGPFCLGQDGGMGGMGGGASSGGGAMGGIMGGPGGVGAFSPFGMAAGMGSGAGGCSGPFCTVMAASSGSTGSAITSSDKKTSDCTGPSCSAKDGTVK